MAQQPTSSSRRDRMVHDITTRCKSNGNNLKGTKFAHIMAPLIPHIPDHPSFHPAMQKKAEESFPNIYSCGKEEIVKYVDSLLEYEKSLLGTLQKSSKSLFSVDKSVAPPPPSLVSSSNTERPPTPQNRQKMIKIISILKDLVSTRRQRKSIVRLFGLGSTEGKIREVQQMIKALENEITDPGRRILQNNSYRSSLTKAFEDLCQGTTNNKTKVNDCKEQVSKTIPTILADPFRVDKDAPSRIQTIKKMFLSSS